MSKAQASSSLREFFSACAQKSFRELGLHDPAITDYVTDVLTTFARTDALYQISTPLTQRSDNLITALGQFYAGMQPSIQGQSADRQEREFRKYTGDYVLFMSGLFRAFVEKKGVLDYYFQEGQRSYRKVSELDVQLYQSGFLLFDELAKNFEFYSGALDYMRKSIFASAAKENPFGQFLRHVEGWFRQNWSEN